MSGNVRVDPHGFGCTLSELRAVSALPLRAPDTIPRLFYSLIRPMKSTNEAPKSASSAAQINEQVGVVRIAVGALGIEERGVFRRAGLISASAGFAARVTVGFGGFEGEYAPLHPYGQYRANIRPFGHAVGARNIDGETDNILRQTFGEEPEIGNSFLLRFPKPLKAGRSYTFYFQIGEEYPVPRNPADENFCQLVQIRTETYGKRGFAPCTVKA